MSTDSEAQVAPVERLPGESRLLAAQLPSVIERFEHYGVIGLLLLDFAMLGEIEESYGGDARRESLASLDELVREVGTKRLADDDLILAGDVGRNEIFVLMFRERRDARFYRQELPGFEQAVRQVLERRGGRVLYPYLRRPPTLGAR